MNIPKFSVKNPVLVNLVMATVIIIGAITAFDLPQELMPNIDFHWVFVIVPYNGASPEEIEELITIPVEDAINSVDKIDMINSTTREGVSNISVKFETISGDEYDKLFQDIKNAVDALDDIPEDAEDPIYFELTTAEMSPVINVNISGILPDREMMKLARDLQRDILDIKHVAKADIAGFREREIWIEIDPERLNNYNLGLNQVVNAIAWKNLNAPGGTMKVGRTEYLLRTIGEIDDVSQLENVVIRKTVNSGQVKVKDVATVIDTLEDIPVYSRLNSLPSLSITVSKDAEGHITEVVKAVRELVDNQKEYFPPGVEVTYTNDTSILVSDFLNVLKSNAYLGLLMVVIVLWLFLGWRNASFAALGIPVTFLCAFIFLKYTGRSLNGSSLFGLVLVLGIVVDDAIIVVENCFRYIQKGYSPIKAAVVGTQEVMVPVLSATATTVAAFLPLMLVPGIMGEFMKEAPITVCLVLAASMVEAFFILPAHVGEWSPKSYRPNKTRFAFFTRMRKAYVKMLVKTLRRRFITVCAVTVLFIFSVIMVFAYLGIDMFSDDELSQFFVWVTMPEGTTLEETNRVITEFEKEAKALPAEDLVAVLAYAGFQQLEAEWLFQPNVSQLFIEVVQAKQRDHNVDYYIDIIREKTKDIAGPKSVQFFKMQTGPPAGPPVEIKVRGKDYDILRMIADEMKGKLSSIEGIYDVKDDFNYGKKEIKIKVDEDRAALNGLDIFQISSAIRTAFDGTVASKLREDDEEIEVIVRFREDYRNELSDFDNMKIVAPNGNIVPVKDIVDYKVEPGYTSIKRVDRERAVTVSSEVDQMKINATAVNRRISSEYSDLSGRFPGYSIKFGGEFDEFTDSLDALWKLFLLGIFLIYIILGGQFKSFMQPLIILYTIPFAFIGAIFALFLINSPFSFNTMYGVVALAGIVVNDALVLISFINSSRQKGGSRWRSIVLGGSVRLRPIILTSVTTIFGMLPMAIGLGGSSKTWGPLAATIVGGLFFSTVFTLFVIPCLFAGVDDIKFFFGMKSIKPSPHLEELESL